MSDNPFSWPYFTPTPKSTMSLDNLGFTVSLKMLEAWPAYSYAWRRLFGRRRLSQLWMRHVFPRLRPTEFAKRRQRFEYLRALMQQELFDAVLALRDKEQDEHSDV